MILIRRKNKVIQDFESCEHKDYKRDLNAWWWQRDFSQAWRAKWAVLKITMLGSSKRFLLFPLTPPPSYFCSRPIFRAGKRRKPRFFDLCSRETLAAQANVHVLNCISESKRENCVRPPLDSTKEAYFIMQYSFRMKRFRYGLDW